MRTDSRMVLEQSAGSEIIAPHDQRDPMTSVAVLYCRRLIGAALKPALLTLGILVLHADDLAAQGQPVQNGPMLPLALWWGGACVLGLVMAYAILRNRSRSRAERDVTDQATKLRYAEEERERAKSGPV